MKQLKHFKKYFAAVMAFVLSFNLVSPALAQTVNVGNGSGSITINNAAQGQTYELYKLFDATVGANGEISYKVPEGKTLAADNTWFEVDTAGNVLAKTDADITTAAFRTWAESFGTKVGDTVTATDNTVVFSELDYGYYFVKSGLGSVITVDSTNPSATIIDKNDTEPVIETEFKTAGDRTAQLGDTINFEVNFTATNYVTKDGATTQVTQYTISDTPTALAINQDSIKVTIDTEDKTNDSNVSISVANGAMTITLTWATAEGTTIYDYSTPVKVEYTATVTNAGADADGIKNSATITYNDTTKTHEVEVNTYQITLNKVDGENNPLTGAQFVIRRNSQDGDALALVDITAEGAATKTYRVATTDDVTTTTVIEAGTAIIQGLDGADTYYLQETTAPAGYNILTTQEQVEMNSADQIVSITNQAGTELPSTGGIGTTIFYVGGGLLVTAAVVMFITKRRMASTSNED